MKLGVDIPFLGREALGRQRREGVSRRLCGFSVLDPDVVMHGRETVFRNDERVGWLTSAGFGHTVGHGIGYGYVRRVEPVDVAWLRSGRYELEVAGVRVPARLHLRPLYDPDMNRVKS